ncbi:MAG: hypothetical protein NVS1B2_19420 [Vulcanimicrobiaceae bacterium]
MAQLLWLKRDVRIDDHEALATAARGGARIVLSVYEPEYYASPEFDPSHHTFVDASLHELEGELARRGGRLTYRAGAMPNVLEALCGITTIEALHSHEETGNAVTYARDCCVRGWAKRWDARMTRPLVPPPASIDSVAIDHERRRTPQDLGFADTIKPDACSRLSPYLTYGTISIKDVYHATLAREIDLRARRADGESIDGRWPLAMRSFRARLHWHCHFMQKLEDQPSLEFVNIARAYDGLREDFDE